jgi:EpsI family protein
MLGRALALLMVFVATGAIVQVAAQRNTAAARSTLSALPRSIGAWQGSDVAALADDEVASLGVDDYVNRRYARYSLGGLPISTYIGYYANQRSGDAIHSPRNCLPGSGWEPVAAGTERIPTRGGVVSVARYEIVKGLDRQMVLYWYQGRGRVVSGEYANKAWLMLDSARSGRSDGGLVRLIGPVVTTPDDTVHEMSSFAAALLSQLSEYLP